MILSLQFPGRDGRSDLGSLSCDVTTHGCLNDGDAMSLLNADVRGGLVRCASFLLCDPCLWEPMACADLPYHASA